MDIGVWRAEVHVGHKESDTTEWLTHTHTHTETHTSHTGKTNMWRQNSGFGNA